MYVKLRLTSTHVRTIWQIEKKQHRNKSKSETFQRVPVVKLELLNMAIYKSKHMKVIVIR